MRPRILIVDDEPNTLAALSALLRDEGYEVASAHDGVSAQGRMVDFHPNVVITDVRLPGLDGRGFLASVRGMQNGPAVVLMSARPPPSGVTAAFVGKPIDIAQLLSIVEAAVPRQEEPCPST